MSDDDNALTTSTSTGELIRRFQAGDESALDRLWARYLPRLTKWAHGRLPRPSQTATDTDDLVQEAFVRSLSHLKTLQPRGDTGVLSYFKTIIMNLVREYIRRGRRRPTSQLDDSDAEEPIEPTPSALEELLGAEVLDRYQRALLSLGEDDQDLILAAVELRLHDAEIAELFEKPSVNAARMARARALGRLARAMEADVHGPRDAV